MSRNYCACTCHNKSILIIGSGKNFKNEVYVVLSSYLRFHILFTRLDQMLILRQTHSTIIFDLWKQKSLRKPKASSVGDRYQRVQNRKVLIKTIIEKYLVFSFYIA